MRVPARSASTTTRTSGMNTMNVMRALIDERMPIATKANVMVPTMSVVQEIVSAT